MDVFFVVLVLLLLAFPIMAIAALVKTVGLGGQLRRVEVRLAALERAAAAPMPGVSEQRAPAEPPAPTAPTDRPADCRPSCCAPCARRAGSGRARAKPSR